VVSRQRLPSSASANKALRAILTLALHSAPTSLLTLDTPTLSYDASAIALSFLPSVPSTSSSLAPPTYRHYRRALYRLALSASDSHSSSSSSAGLPLPQSRYTVPSAHITLARFVQPVPQECIEHLVDGLDDVATRVRDEIQGSLKWTFEHPVDARRGRVWYGGGEAVSRD
jgi:hypothetical protein